MSEDTPRKSSDSYAGNVAVTAGGILIMVCFALPWVRRGHLSALAMATQPEKAISALASLDLMPDDPEAFANDPAPRIFLRPLYMIPVLALLCMMLEWTVPPGSSGRAVARVSLLIAGAALSTFFVFFGLRFGSHLAYGFWGAMNGALFITVGAAFSVLRRE